MKTPPYIVVGVFFILAILLAFVASIVFWETQCTSLSCWSVPMPTIVANEEYEWTIDDAIWKLIKDTDLSENSYMFSLQKKICKKAVESPLCKDIEILRRIDTIATSKWVPTTLILGIMLAESTLATNYNKPICKTYNNPYWIKGRKYDNGKIEWYTKTKGRPDSNWCWLYKFDSIDEATYSLANTISIGYKSCNNNVRCISYAYVGDPNVAEESWIARVQSF